MKKPYKVTLSSLDQVMGETFIDFEHVDSKSSCCEGSEEVVLHFTNGKEIAVYVVRGEVIVEGD